MSTGCYFQSIAPQVLKKLQFHPGVVDIFQSAFTLQDYSADYWKGIEELEGGWESESEDLGEQERITLEIYEQIQSDIPMIISAGLVGSCWVGSADSFDWLETQGIISTEIGNDSYYGRLTYLMPEQVQTMADKLQNFRRQSSLEVYKILHPQSYELEQNDEAESEFWQHFDEVLTYCQRAVENGDSMLLSYG